MIHVLRYCLTREVQLLIFPGIFGLYGFALQLLQVIRALPVSILRVHVTLTMASVGKASLLSKRRGELARKFAERCINPLDAHRVLRNLRVHAVVH